MGGKNHFVSGGSALAFDDWRSSAPAPGGAALLLAGGSRPRGSGSHLTVTGRCIARVRGERRAAAASHERPQRATGGESCCYWQVTGSQQDTASCVTTASGGQATAHERPRRARAASGIRCTTSWRVTGVCGSWIQRAASVRIQASKLPSLLLFFEEKRGDR